MKKREGFTLIELLAVIVILAVIALIATPLIMNVIGGAQKGAFQNTAYGILEAAKYTYTNEVIKDGKANLTVYKYANGVESSIPADKKLAYKGSVPKSGTIIINSKGDTALAIYNGEYCVQKDYDDVEVTISTTTEANCVLTATLTEVEVLVVAGGGGGGNDYGGGGGAGGVIYNKKYEVTGGQTITVTVGAGGTGAPAVRSDLSVGQSGQNSIFGTFIVKGGGGGGGSSVTGANGKPGGSGGGGSGYVAGTGGTGTAGQGNVGGIGGAGAQDYQGGGGGGAGQAGTAGATTAVNAKGGDGLQFDISGTLKYYGGGGGAGSGYTTTADIYGLGGLGGGGRGATHTLPAESGQANTGGGGGGANRYATGGQMTASSIGPGGNGGSGIVIVRYYGPKRANGGTVTTVNGYTIHTFTSGTSTFEVLNS